MILLLHLALMNWVGMGGSVFPLDLCLGRTLTSGHTPLDC